MVLAPSSFGFINTGGIIRATGGGLASFNGGGYTNTGGTITADTGSAVRLNHAAPPSSAAS